MSAVQKQVTKINHPFHYNKGEFEAIDVIEDWDLNFNVGNAIKYIARAPYKNNRIEDYEKAIWYLQREIQRIQNKKASQEVERIGW